MPECNEAKALRNCALELVEILRSDLARTGVVTPVVHLVHGNCLEEVVFDARVLNSPAGKRSLGSFLRKRAQETGFDGRAFLPRRDGIEGVAGSLLSHLALEAAAFGHWTEAIFVMVETRLLTVMVLQPYVRSEQGIEFGAVQCVDTTESAVELCGLMRVFQDPIPA